MEFYIDLFKAIDMSKLVKKPVQVHGHNGHIFTRMQWVDPETGKPISEEHHGEGPDPHEHHLKKLDPDNRIMIASRLSLSDRKWANSFANHVSGQENQSHEVITRHIRNNLHKVPVDRLRPHINATRGDLGYGKQPMSAPLSIRSSGKAKGLHPHEVAMRMGEVGPLDLRRLTIGEDIVDEFDYEFRKSTEVMMDPGARRGMRVPYEDHDLRANFRNIFGGTTKQGLEYVFSDPDRDMKAEMIGVSSYVDNRTGSVVHEINFGMYSMDGETRIGDISRSIRREKDGSLHVVNELLEIRKSHHGKGLAENLYARSEQFWRHLSGGNPLSIGITANISVGVYAWATKGFDFQNSSYLYTMQDELEGFCDQNGIDVKDVLKKNGYKNLDEIEHPWEFAALNYTKKYDVTRELDGVEKDERLRDLNTKPVHFGKAFMLLGASSWEGIRYLNQSVGHDDIYNPLEPYKPRESD